MLKKALVGMKDVLVRLYAKVPTMVKQFALMLAAGLLMGTVLGFGQLAIAWSGN